MSRSYRHIKEHEKEILELKSQGLTEREIGNQLGFSIKQIHNFITRYNAKQRKLEAGITIKPKGRPRKDGNVYSFILLKCQENTSKFTGDVPDFV